MEATTCLKRRKKKNQWLSHKVAYCYAVNYVDFDTVTNNQALTADGYNKPKKKSQIVKRIMKDRRLIHIVQDIDD